MPPVDNNTPTPQVPTPVPQPEPKQGFFAKLFGKKPQETPAVPQFESHTPPPQLGDTDSTDGTNGPIVPTEPVSAPVPDPFDRPEVPETPDVSVPPVSDPTPGSDVPPAPQPGMGVPPVQSLDDENKPQNPAV